MDIYCPRCGEPCDIDALHDYAQEYGRTFSQVRDAFASDGCGIAFDGWGWTCDPKRGDSERALISATLFELLGDDIDGIAAEMEDWGF